MSDTEHKTTRKRNFSRSLDQRTRRFSRAYLLGTLLVLSILFLYMIRIFLIPITLSAVFTSLFFGLHRWIRKAVRGRRNLASLITVIVLFIILLLPLTFIGNVIAQQAITIYNTSEEAIRQFLSQHQAQPLGALRDTQAGQWIEEAGINLQESLTNIARMSGKLVGDVINRTSKTTFQFMINIAVVFFTMFYLFRDGEKLIERIKFLSPLPGAYEESLFYSFMRISKATVKGTLVIGVIQGTLGAIVLAVFGIPSVMLLGVLMVLLAIVPLLGPYLVLIPAAIYKMIIGDVWQGLAIALLSFFVVSTVDNLIRPRLVGSDSGLHDLIIFFSTLGGIAVFGVMGFIVGPVIAALLFAFLDIYGREFHDQLEHAEQTIPGKPEDDLDDEEA